MWRNECPSPAIASTVIPAKAGIQCLYVLTTLGPRLRGDDELNGCQSMNVGLRASAQPALYILALADKRSRYRIFSNRLP